MAGVKESPRARTLASANDLVRVRAPLPEDGESLSRLWKLLWDVHESWGSYPGSRDPDVYRELSLRLTEEARVRGPRPLSGRHVHLVAALVEEGNSRTIGQVEGWIDRHGIDPRTKWTCEVRSLVVSEDGRHVGAARALLDGLAGVARDALHGSPAVLAAEVLEDNPAMAFYRRVGFHTPAHSVRMRTDVARDVRPLCPARIAVPQDALPLAFLEGGLAERRRLARDDRFDRPRALDAAFVDAIATHLALASQRGTNDPAELIAVDGKNLPRASATLAFAALEPPFLPGVRAVLSRVSVDATTPPSAVVPGLVSLAGRLAKLAGAEHLEIVDLPPAATPLHDALVAVGAGPWSRVALRDV